MSEKTSPTEGANQKVVAFRVSEQDFCVDIMSVREIRGWTQATALPHAPGYVMGVINLRGAVVPVLDLAARLGLGALDPGPRHVIVIAMIDGQTVGLLADVVSDILNISADRLQPVPDVASETAKAFITGIIATEERMIRKIDLGRVVPSLQGVAA